MIKDNIYNVVKYLKMIKEIKTMNFESIFSNYQKCNEYKRFCISKLQMFN